MPGGGNTYKRILCSCLCCKNVVSSNNLATHYKSKQCLSGFTSTKSHATIVTPQDLTCVFCNKQCKNKNSYRQHSIRCNKNPNAIQVKRPIGNKTKERTPWNKGLTKESDERVKKNAVKTQTTMKKLYDSGYRTPTQMQSYWTDEKRKQKSEWRKKLHKDNPETHPNRRLAGNRNKMTYPEKVAYDWLTSNQIKFKHNELIGIFYPDFVIGSIIIEIDGEYWHSKEIDDIKDNFFRENGYTVYRIKSKDKIEKN
jgi:very-short-patch-repair endonuclease